jgi:hypothetical protein
MTLRLLNAGLRLIKLLIPFCSNLTIDSVCRHITSPFRASQVNNVKDTLKLLISVILAEHFYLENMVTPRTPLINPIVAEDTLAGRKLNELQKLVYSLNFLPSLTLDQQFILHCYQIERFIRMRVKIS